MNVGHLSDLSSIGIGMLRRVPEAMCCSSDVEATIVAITAQANFGLAASMDGNAKRAYR